MFTDLGVCRNRDGVRPIQIVFGKAHPHDGGGKDLIRRIHQAAAALADRSPWCTSRTTRWRSPPRWSPASTSGSNNPMKPLEASGTSGMKARSRRPQPQRARRVVDRGPRRGVTGWSIGGLDSTPTNPRTLTEIYLKLERVILPLYYGLPFAYAEVMRSAISINGSFFNTQRMVEQYVRNAYYPDEAVSLAVAGR